MRHFATALFVLSLSAALGAQEAPAAAPKFGFGGSLGTEVITEMVNGTLTPVTYQFVSFIPDLALGPFGVGLDVKLNYRFYRWAGDAMGFYVRPADWIVDRDSDGVADADASFSDLLDLYLAKIVYLRYGQKREAIYAKLGLIEDGTLGNGFILGNYSNGMLRPETKVTGLSFDLDGALFNFPLIGFETFAADLSRFNLVGGRLFLRPLTLLDLPLLKDLQIGGSAVYDGNPLKFYEMLDQESLQNPLSVVPAGDVLVYGIDAFQPLVNLPILSLAAFGDVVNQNNNWGTMIGLGGKVLGFMDFSAQARFLGPNFQPTYFDRAYDLNRTEKFLVYSNQEGYTVPGFNGWFASLGFSFLDGQVFFRSSVEGPLGPLDNAFELVAYPKLRSQFRLDGTQFLPVPLSFDGYYDKDVIKGWEDLISAENANIGAKLNYQAGPAVLSLVYNVKFVPESQRLQGQDPWIITSKLETAIKFR